MNTTKSIDEVRPVNPNSTKTGTKTGTKPPALVKIASMTTAAEYLAQVGPPKAVGLSLPAQLLWHRLMLMGGPIQRIGDRTGSVVFGHKSRVAALAESMNTSGSTVRRAMSELVDAGVVVRKRRTRGYETHVLLPDMAASAVAPKTTATVTVSDPSDGVTIEPSPPLTGGLALTHEPVHGLTHEPVHGLTGEPSMYQTKTQSKTQSNHHHARAEPTDAEQPCPADPDGGGGGGDAVQDQGNTDQARRQQVRDNLASVGCWVGKLDELTDKVMSMPDGPDRLDKTYESIRRTSRSPVAVLVRRIEDGNLDPLTELERQSLDEQRRFKRAEQEFAQRGETFEAWCHRMADTFGDDLHVATQPLQRLVRRVVHGDKAGEYKTALKEFKGRGRDDRRRFLIRHENASIERLNAHRDSARGEHPDELQDVAHELSGKRFRASDAMRAVLSGTKFTETKTPNPLAGLASVSAPSR